VKLARLWQPRRGDFWLMIGFNALSSALGWAMRALPLNDAAMIGAALLALGNVGAGLLCAWRLVADPAPPAPPAR
jgi:hypothetical protein